MLRIRAIHLENFRCFEVLDVAFESDVTVLIAENGGGKTAVLTAVAMGLALLQPKYPKELELDVSRDARQVPGAGGRREPTGVCTIRWSAAVATSEEVRWQISASPTSNRRDQDSDQVSAAIEAARQPGERWPLLAYYGTGRFLAEGRTGREPATDSQDRWEAYSGCLDPLATDGPLLDWLKAETFGDLVRQGRGETERRLAVGVLEAIARSTPGIEELWYDPAIASPVARFDTGRQAPWRELSDGFHVYMSLIGDIARRAVILNEHDGARAPLLVEGVVLIDEVDLHLHPRWQRVVLGGLRTAFPKLQFIVTTHSPQVLSSAENRQVRRLEGWALRDVPVYVEGRDSNAILRVLKVEDRDSKAVEELAKLYAAIDDGDLATAKRIFSRLREQWGDLDPELIRAQAFMDDLEEEVGEA